MRQKPRRIYIPDENIASVQIITDQQFSVVGKKAGSTVLNLWFPNPADPNDPKLDRTLSYLVVVLPDFERSAVELLQERKRLEAQASAYQQALKVLQQEIKQAFPDIAVQLSLVGDQVVVRGESKDIVEAAQILGIVAAHAPTGRRTRVDNSPNLSTVFIPGLGNEQAAVNAIRQLLQGNPNIVNLLRVPGEQQVMLMVTVAEVNRTAARTIGMDFTIPQGKFKFGQLTGGLLSAVGAASMIGGNLPVSIDNGNILLAIQALRTMNFARSLAEPNLTTLNGRQANFQAGGSFPLPTSVVLPGGAAQSVSYQNFGVSLQFTPYITDHDRIRLRAQRQCFDPQHRYHASQRGGRAQPNHPTLFQHHRRTSRRPNAHRGRPDPEQFQRHVESRPALGRSADHRTHRRPGQRCLGRTRVGRPGHARAGPSIGPVQDAAIARPRRIRAGRRGVLYPGTFGRSAHGRLPRFGPHGLLPAEAVVRMRGPLHHWPARPDVWLLQFGKLRMSKAARVSGGYDACSRANPNARANRNTNASANACTNTNADARAPNHSTHSTLAEDGTDALRANKSLERHTRANSVRRNSRSRLFQPVWVGTQGVQRHCTRCHSAAMRHI